MKIVIAFLLSLSAANAAEPPAMNVLFIGNSMTWFNNMPRIVAELARASDPPTRLNPYQACVSTATLARVHRVEDSLARKALAGGVSNEGSKSLWKVLPEKDEIPKEREIADDAVVAFAKPPVVWDVVVIQPWAADNSKAQDLTASLGILIGDLRKVSPKARAILYLDATQVMEKTDTETKRRLDARMALYREAAAKTGAEVAPAALACWLANTQLPANSLKYAAQPENIHPGQRGSYLIACSIYAAIFGKSPEGLPVERIEMHFKVSKTGKSHDTRETANPALKGTGTEAIAKEPPYLTLTRKERDILQSAAWLAQLEWAKGK